MAEETIGGYRLLQVLGEGAAGEVHLATPMTPKPFARPGDPLALKKYKPDILRQAGQLERIQREFTVGSTMAHPNLVRMHDYSSKTDHDGPFLVMEYVDGMTLDKWINMFHPISGRLLLRIAEKLVGAIECLHQNRIIHRDIKPSNIMISSNFDVKIMDFGVVRITHDTALTPKDKFLGTIRNSSPELLYGQTYDHRTDLYSLGTVFYNLLHGEEVFAEEDQFARLIEKVKNEIPHFQSSISNQNETSATLLELTINLLEKRPEIRTASADEIKTRFELIRQMIPSDNGIEPLHGYIATALTGLEADAREAIIFTSSKIVEVAKEHHLYVYQPRKASDPLLHKDLEPDAVYMLDRKRVIGADVLLVLANQTSFGVGQEIEIASSYSKPTILVVREGVNISRMVTGSFANFLDDERIVYSTPEDLARKLHRFLSRNLTAIREWKQKFRTSPGVGIGQKIAQYRERAGHSSPQEFAKILGISPRVLKALENGNYENIGVRLLTNICRGLIISMRTLFEDDAVSPKAESPDRNLKRLEILARNHGWSAEDFIGVRDDYLKQLAASGENDIISNEKWIERRSALEQRKLSRITRPSQKDLF